MITQEMTVPQILAQYPQTQAVFERYGIHPYKAAEFENLCATARVNQVAVDELLNALNATLH
jgi:hypothetical protein